MERCACVDDFVLDKTTETADFEGGLILLREALSPARPGRDTGRLRPERRKKGS